MEDIKSDFEKMFERYDNPATSSMPRRLSFNTPEESIDFIPKKRKITINGGDTSIGQKSSRETSSDRNSTVDTSANTSVTLSSPWEARRNKIDLIEANAKITQMRKDIERQNKIRKEMEVMYREKVRALERDAEHGSAKIADLEKHLTSMRRRETAAKESAAKAANDLNEQKSEYETVVNRLEHDNYDLRQKYQEMENKLAGDVSKCNLRIMELEAQLEIRQADIERITSMLKPLQEKEQRTNELEIQLETNGMKLTEALARIKVLEYDVESYGEWKEQSKNTLSRLSNVTELEHEVLRLRAEKKQLRDAIGNNLLMEEEVHNLKTRVEQNANKHAECVALKVQLHNIEQEVKDWRAVGVDHCGNAMLVNPSALRANIEMLLRREIAVATEKNTAQNTAKSSEAEIKDLMVKLETEIKTSNDLRTSLKLTRSWVHRLQKKLSLVSKERDCFKQLIDNYEKDLTISGPVTDLHESHLQKRCDMLEKLLNDYKEMDSESQATKSDLNPNHESFVSLRRDYDELRIENSQLVRQKITLETEMEQMRRKFVDNRKVLHMAINPSSEASQNHESEYQKLQAENERLRRQNQRITSEAADLTSRLNETITESKEVIEMKEQINQLELKCQKVKDTMRTVQLDFRNVVNLLFGYRVDRVGSTNYKLTSTFGRNEDYFLFHFATGTLDMLETPYYNSLRSLMQTHLGPENSLPVFLSALTMELFKSTQKH